MGSYRDVIDTTGEPQKTVLKMREDYAAGDSIKSIAARYGWNTRNTRNAISGHTYASLPNAQYVVSGKNNSEREEEIIKAIQDDPRQRGYVRKIMAQYDITYETFKRLRAIALNHR